MPLHHIRRWEFIRHFPDHLFFDRILNAQIAWFANEDRSILGAIGQTSAGRREYAVLRGKPGSGYHLQKIKSGLASQSQARRRALAALGVKAAADALVPL